MLRKVLVLFFIWNIVLMPSVSFGAEAKDEWVNKGFNLKQIKSVIVQYNVQGDVKLSEDDNSKIDTLVKKIFKETNNKREKLKYLSMQQVEEAIGKTVELNLLELKENDNEQYETVMQNHLAEFADATLQVNIIEHGYTTVHVPQNQIAYPEVQQVPYTNGQGQLYYNPVVNIKYITVPEHDEQIAHAGVHFTFRTTKDKQDVWRFQDIREASDKDPMGMTERIFNNAKSKLKKLIK